MSSGLFLKLENANDGTDCSRAYVNPWIQENRYKNHALILDPDGTELPWPPTNMVLVAFRIEHQP